MTTQFIVSVLLLCIIIQVMLSNRKSLLSMRYRYKLFALRDKLRLYAVQGQINPDLLIFKYLESSINLTIHKLNRMNFFYSYFIYRRNKGKEEYLAMQNILQNELKNNAAANEIYDEYGQILFQYIVRKHFLIRLFFATIRDLNDYTRKTGNSAKNVIKSLRTTPETSTVYILSR